jgi:Domain of unknown function (DUF5655)/Domain of unknown function (DUF4287)
MSDKIDAATATMIRNLEAQSGKSLAQWKQVVAGLGLKKHGEIVKALKAGHGLGHGYANLVAHHAIGTVDATGAGGGDALVDALYAGERAALRPIHEAIVDAVKGFGADVEIAPKKTCVSLRRSKQFALVQPTTKTRVDVGINLKGVPAAGRLELSGSFNAMVSHRVRITAVGEVDPVLVGWLRDAYDRA